MSKKNSSLARIFAIGSSFLIFGSAQARSLPPRSHDASLEEVATVMNEPHHQFVVTSEIPLRPVEDTASFQYVLMSAEEGNEDVPYLRQAIAQNLPEGVTLVILAQKSNAAAVQKKYLKWIPAHRLIIATDSTIQGGFWARDSFPVPVYGKSGQAELVAARYYRPFSSWDAVAGSVQAAITKHDFTFVGGNLLADEDGNCFSVNSYRLFTIHSEDFSSAYGCKTHTMLEHKAGIGDVDEVIKPLSGRRMLTNVAEYKPLLESLGYKVILLPKLKAAYRTYANSLLVKDVAFVPSYGGSEDAAAQKVYEDLGYKVVMIPTINLSDDMRGSIHCQTMAYPAMSRDALLQGLEAQEFLE